jgi:hypothetical protein
MLQINLDKVCFVAVEAREFQAQEETPDEDVVAPAEGEEFHSVLLADLDDPTYGELVGFIDNLNVDEQAELVALAWIGRGDYVAAELGQAAKDAADRHTGSTGKYLLGIPLLPDYLEDALSQLGYSCDEFEK